KGGSIADGDTAQGLAQVPRLGGQGAVEQRRAGNDDPPAVRAEYTVGARWFVGTRGGGDRAAARGPHGDHRSSIGRQRQKDSESALRTRDDLCRGNRGELQGSLAEMADISRTGRPGGGRLSGRSHPRVAPSADADAVRSTQYARRRRNTQYARRRRERR